MALNTDLTLACNEANRAALTNIYLAEACGITSFTASGSNMSFTAVAMDSTADVFYKYEAEFETKELNIEGANENGTPTFTNTVTAKFLGIDKTKLQRLMDIINSKRIVAVVESTNKVGTYNRAFIVGWDSIIGINAAARPNVSGTIAAALDGDNSLTLTLTAKHAELIREFVGTINLSSGTAQFGS